MFLITVSLWVCFFVTAAFAARRRVLMGRLWDRYHALPSLAFDERRAALDDLSRLNRTSLWVWTPDVAARA